jgi:hypothetical protein
MKSKNQKMLETVMRQMDPSALALGEVLELGWRIASMVEKARKGRKNVEPRGMAPAHDRLLEGEYLDAIMRAVHGKEGRRLASWRTDAENCYRSR